MRPGCADEYFIARIYYERVELFVVLPASFRHRIPLVIFQILLLGRTFKLFLNPLFCFLGLDFLFATFYLIPQKPFSYKSVHNRTYIFLSCIEGCLGPKEAANFIRAMC